MIEIFLEIAVSICICGAVAYFFFLTDPIVERDVSQENTSGSRHNINSDVYGSCSSPVLERSRKCEGAVWFNVLCRWVALLVLGGGSIDKDVWTDRIAFFLEKATLTVDEAFRRAQVKKETQCHIDSVPRSLHMNLDVVRLLRVELSGGGPLSMSGVAAQPAQQQQQQQQQHSTQSVANGLFHAGAASESAVLRSNNTFVESPMLSVVQENLVATAPPIGVVLPRVGNITSFEAPHTSSDTACGGTEEVPRTLRCFRVPISYEDQRFAIQLACNLPLLFALPASLQIPADLLSLRCTLSVKRVAFHSVLHATFHRGVVELSFASDPQFTATYDVAPAKRYRVLPHAGPSSASQRGGAPSSSCAGDRAGMLPPLPPGSGWQQERPLDSLLHVAPTSRRSKEKLQELVDLAVRRAVRSITYPCVLQGRVGRTHKTNEPGGDAQWDTGLMTWSLAKATLPLCC